MTKAVPMPERPPYTHGHRGAVRAPSRIRRSAMSDLDMARIEAIRAASQDDETRGLIRLAKANTWPRLATAGWQLRFEGDDGIGCADRGSLRVIHSIAREEDGRVWAHVSLSRRDGSMPEWSQARDAWRLFYPDLIGLIIVAPEPEHVNRAEVAHVWGCLTERVTPDFTRGLGTI